MDTFHSYLICRAVSLFRKILKKPIFRLNQGVYQKKYRNKPPLKFHFLPYIVIFSAQSTLGSEEMSVPLFKGGVF